MYDFASRSAESLAAQCRMQARENLDPEYGAFMLAVADRLSPAPEAEIEEHCTCQGGADQPGGVALRANDCPLHGEVDEPPPAP